MKNALSLLSLGVALVVMAPAAQARPLRAAKTDHSAAAHSRRAAAEGFAARMHRLDALMGTAPVSRTRSASADR